MATTLPLIKKIGLNSSSEAGCRIFTAKPYDQAWFFIKRIPSANASSFHTWIMNFRREFEIFGWKSSLVMMIGQQKITPEIRWSKVT